MLRPARQAALAVFGQDVLHDRARFREHHPVILDHRGRPQRVQRLQLGRRQDGDGVTRVMLQRVGEAELLTQPGNALGLRMAEMVDREHRVLLYRRNRLPSAGQPHAATPSLQQSCLGGAAPQ